MRKIFFLSLLQLFLFSYSIAQDNYFDSLKQLISTTQDDTLTVQRILSISRSYIYLKPDSGLLYAKRGLEISQRISYSHGEARSYYIIGSCLSVLGDYAGSLSFGFKALKLFQEINEPIDIILTTETIGTHYRDQGDYLQALKYLLKAHRLAKALPEKTMIKNELNFEYPIEDQLNYLHAEIGFSYINSNPDSALFYAAKSHAYFGHRWLYPIVVIGNAYLGKKQFDSALNYFRSGLALIPHSSSNDVADDYIGIANAFRNQSEYDSCVFYAKKGLELCQDINYLNGIYNASGILSSVYENIDPVQSIKYYKLNKATNDSLFNQQKTRDAQSFAFNEQLHQQELQQKLKREQLVNKNRQNIIILLAGLAIFLIMAIGLWRKNIYKQKSYAILQKQKQEIDIQKGKVETTLDELKTTQAQLIQSEKMASLGELTAGIAHEIQNPLNFVNNFSEVNKELIAEMKDEIKKGNFDEVNAIAKDIEENEEKINHHGKRAGDIVKGMLQHSRNSSGKKEPTDINALADEYLRLSYHGLRAKDNSFNATMKTDFDNSIGKINIIPQDIGRVMLNLINNAFYAVNEKQQQNMPGYEPTVTVNTRNVNDKIEISVKDNGNGIPQKILDKIFQPFFTTKPTGQGTGLGLSLSYDIVKAHGGDLKVKTKEGEGSEFIIRLNI